MKRFACGMVGLFIWLSACQSLFTTPAPLADTAAPLANQLAVAKPTAVFTPTLRPTATETAVLPTPTATPSLPTPTTTPFFRGTPSPPCGQILPLLASESQPQHSSLVPNETAVAELRNALPENSQPVLDYILAHPENVALVAYRLSEEQLGVFLNPDRPMPLASVSKLIILVAYVEAVGTGELDPNQLVSIPLLERYYLPNTDLGTHNLALSELEENGRLVNNSVTLNDIAWMMMRHSSNAASDYLQRLLGQVRIEETAVSLDLSQQTAPCPYLSQFLAVANHTRTEDSLTAVRAYLANPEQYAQEATLLADAFSQDPDFRQAELAWRSIGRRSGGGAQRLFSDTLNAQGTAREYAALMGRFSLNGLSSGDSSFRARLLLEWPMQFGNNQLVFDNLGYKNGSLPGILTTAYYAYPKGTTTPVVVTLFFRNLDSDTYRDWRFRNLPHDEFARWLLANPAAIPQLKAALNLP